MLLPAVPLCSVHRSLSTITSIASQPNAYMGLSVYCQSVTNTNTAGQINTNNNGLPTTTSITSQSCVYMGLPVYCQKKPCFHVCSHKSQRVMPESSNQLVTMHNSHLHSQCIIRPKLEYADAVWSNVTECQSDDIEMVQKKAARITSGAIRGTETVKQKTASNVANVLYSNFLR